MHESKGHAAFSYAARSALDRVVANVTYTEEARKICIQQKWSTICRPTWLVAHLASRSDIAVFPLELRWQPIGHCIGPDHDKQAIRSPPDDPLPPFSVCLLRSNTPCRLQRPPEFRFPPECPAREQSDQSSIAT